MSDFGMKVASINLTLDVSVDTVSAEKVRFDTGSFCMMVPTNMSALELTQALRKAIDKITFEEPEAPSLYGIEETP